MPWCDKTRNLQSATPIVAERKGPHLCFQVDLELLTTLHATLAALQTALCRPQPVAAGWLWQALSEEGQIEAHAALRAAMIRRPSWRNSKSLKLPTSAEANTARSLVQRRWTAVRWRASGRCWPPPTAAAAPQQRPPP